MTVDAAMEIIRDVGQRLVQRRNEFGLLRIVLFGSVARGTCGPNSDVDLLLVTRSSETYLALHDFCEEIECSGCPVDFTILPVDSLHDSTRDSALKAEIRKDGIQVWPQ